MRRALGLLCLSATTIGLLLPCPASAVQMYWDTSTDTGIQAGDGTWDSSGNAMWSNDVAGSAPLLLWTSAADDAVFHTSGTSTITVSSAVVNGITFAGTGYTLNSGNLALGAGGITANESGTINSGISLGGSQTWSVAADKTLSIGQGDTYIGSGVTLTKNGAGSAAFGSGWIRVGSDASGTGTMTIENGTVQSGLLLLAAGGSNNCTGVLNISGGQMITWGDLYVGWNGNGTVNQTGGTVHVGTNLLFCTDVDNSTGTYNLNGGTLKTQNISTTAGAAKNRTTLLSINGGTLENSGLGTLSTDIAVTIGSNGGTFSSPSASAGIQLTGALTGSGTITKTGDSSLDLAVSNASNFTGNINIDAGSVVLSNNRLASAGTVTVASSGLLSVNGNISLPQNLVLNGGALRNTGSEQLVVSVPASIGDNGGIVDGAGDVQIVGTLSGGGGLTKSGTGVLRLSAASGSSHAGSIFVNQGELVVDNANLATTRERIVVGNDVNDTGTMTVNGATLNMSGFLLVAGGGSLNSNGVLNVSSGTINVGNQFYVGWKGNGTVNQTGGTIQVTGTGVDAGLLFCTDVDNSVGTYNLNGGTLKTPGIFTALGNAKDRTMLLSFGGGTLQFTGIGTMGTDLPIAITSGGATIDTPYADTNLALTGTVSGAGSLTKTGLGVLTLASSASYGGDTTVNGGTLSLGRDFLANNSKVSISGALLNLNYNATDVIGALYFNGMEQAAGIWGAMGSGAQHESAFLTGTGFLQVIPEPSSIALLAAGFVGLLAYAWRKRK